MNAEIYERQSLSMIMPNVWPPLKNSGMLINQKSIKNTVDKATTKRKAKSFRSVFISLKIFVILRLNRYYVSKK